MRHHRRTTFRAGLAFLAMFWLPAIAAARPVVDVELVLAVDVSLSMDHEEQQLQRDGYVAAFRDRQLLQAIAAGPNGRIAVTYIEWAGEYSQQTVIGWTIIESRASAAAFADRLAAAPISRLRMTSISGALRYAAAQFELSPVQGVRKVIDISGDGPNNSGAPVTPARDETIARGIVINGLPIMLRPSQTSFFDIPQLDRYYEKCVIGGPGAFVVAVRKRAEFVPAIRRKLILEVSGIMPLTPRLIRTAAGERLDCGVGEKRWRQYMKGNPPSR